MSVLLYVVGAVSVAVGGLIAAWHLLSLKTGSAWSGRPRREAWSNLGSSLGAVFTGTFLLLGGHDETARWLVAIAFTALLIWQLRSEFRSRAQRRSAS
jgi:hypothetical protein